MMRVGLYRPVHVKTLRSQKLRMLLTHRKLLQSKAIAIENDLRATLRNFGLKVGMAGRMKFEMRIKELVQKQPDLGALVEHCSLSGECYANRPSSCIVACWPSSETMTFASS
jgi:transposase